MSKDNQHIPSGYKPSPLGPIPEDWEVKRLGDYVTITSGESPSLYVLKTTGRFPYVKVEDMNNCSKYQTQSREYSDIEKSVVPKGSIIFPKRGAAILNNKVRIAQTDLLMDSNMMAITPKDGQLDSEYLYYTIIKEQLYKIADTSTIPQINNKHIIPYRFCLPSLVEQKEIVSLLITWDTAIEKQTALIEKLSLRKRGLMQQLLTGKKRLKGFGEAWKRYKLKELCSLIKGEQLNSDTLSERGLYPVINGGINPSGYYDKYNSMENTITISEGGNSCGYVNFIKTKFWSGGHCYMVKDLQNVDLYYLYYALKHIEPHIMNLRVGSGLPNVQLGPLQKLILIAPSIEEQTAIASVLVNADKEIEIQKQKLSSLQSQKRGLMQQLLTGKKRIKKYNQWQNF